MLHGGPCHSLAVGGWRELRNQWAPAKQWVHEEKPRKVHLLSLLESAYRVDGIFSTIHFQILTALSMTRHFAALNSTMKMVLLQETPFKNCYVLQFTSVNTLPSLTQLKELHTYEYENLYFERTRGHWLIPVLGTSGLNILDFIFSQISWSVQQNQIQSLLVHCDF